MNQNNVYCEYCDEFIGWGSDCYVSTDTGLYFCDHDCAEQYYEIRPHTLDELDVVETMNHDD